MTNIPITVGRDHAEVSIRILKQSDIPDLVLAFEMANWPKPASVFQTYLKEQNNKQRMVWVALASGQLAGYVTLKWQSYYPGFASANIPEIMDLNVLPSFRKKGIGLRLLQTAEQEAATKTNIVGLGVGLYAGSDGGYGAAQKLYVKQGYVPDGKGVTYNYQFVIPGESYPLDDDLVLWFIKNCR